LHTKSILNLTLER